MPDFLSPEWISALDDAARTSDRLAAIGKDDAFVVEQRVTDAPDGEACYHARLGPDGARVVQGPAPSPDVILVTDYETALALHRGETNAQRAIAAGRMKLRGHVELLLRRADALAALGDVFSATRTADKPNA
jgi:hypothetical protein